MNDYEKMESNCLEQMEGDYMPLHDLVREFSGYDQSPTESEFMNSLKFIDYLSKKYRIKILQGPEMKEINKPTNKMIEWLKECWYSNKYDEINYMIWLKKD
jgi:hypothetical protein